jgi:hypothetical protein
MATDATTMARTEPEVRGTQEFVCVCGSRDSPSDADCSASGEDAVDSTGEAPTVPASQGSTPHNPTCHQTRLPMQTVRHRGRTPSIQLARHPLYQQVKEARHTTLHVIRLAFRCRLFGIGGGRHRFNWQGTHCTSYTQTCHKERAYGKAAKRIP